MFWAVLGNCLGYAAIGFGALLIIIGLVAIFARRPLMQSMGSHGDTP